MNVTIKEVVVAMERRIFQIGGERADVQAQIEGGEDNWDKQQEYIALRAEEDKLTVGVDQLNKYHNKLKARRY